jgi:hypothetical protein
MTPRAVRAEKVVMIGLRPEEDEWVKLLVSLLRNRDPVMGELVRQAMVYLRDTAERRSLPAAAER